jgi:hypothetical protein
MNIEALEAAVSRRHDLIPLPKIKKKILGPVQLN